MIYDYDLNSHENKILVQIEGSEEWVEIQHEDLFDYLMYTGKIDGHDPQSKAAWIDDVQTIWNPQRQEPVEINRGTSSSYAAWIEQLVDDDLIQEYVDTLKIVSEKNKA